MTPHILAGDIGGTKCSLGLYTIDRSGDPLPVTSVTVPSNDAPSAADLIHGFLKNYAGARVSSACFGYAGPVVNGEAKGTNLPWPISAQEISRKLNIPTVRVINDLAALAVAVPHLPDTALLTLQPGTADPTGNIALLAAGTGLGEALLIRHQGKAVPIASEGGHKDFTPKNHLEYRLCSFLFDLYGHASIERVLSGRGLIDLYRFLLTEHGNKAPDWFAATLASGDATEITTKALAGSDPVCRLALDLFATLYGAEAGNLALQYLATGGVYIGGGIAPKIQQSLRSPGFRLAFNAKGRMQPLLASIPVFLILDPTAALLGAAYYAADLCLAGEAS